MCDKAVDNYPHALEFFPDYKRCVIKLSILIPLQWNLFLNAIRLKNWVICSWYLILFLTGKKTHEMCDRVVSEDPFW